MAEYVAEVIWTRDGQDFLGNRYSRKHVLRFDGGLEIPGSSSPQTCVARLYMLPPDIRSSEHVVSLLNRRHSC